MERRELVGHLLADALERTDADQAFGLCRARLAAPRAAPVGPLRHSGTRQHQPGHRDQPPPTSCGLADHVGGRTVILQPGRGLRGR